MIPELQGLLETPEYRPNRHLRLYENTLCENYPPHWHSPMEFLMPIDNEYTVIINDKKYVVNPYEILCVGSGVIHSCEAPKTGKRYFLQIDVTRLTTITGVNSIISFIGPVLHITPKDAPDIHRQIVGLFDDIVDEYFRSEEFELSSDTSADGDNSISRSTLSEPIIYAKFLTMLTLIGRSHLDRISPNIGSGMKSKEYIDKFMVVCQYIDQHFAEELDLESIAAMAGFSKFHFSRLFKEFANISFYKYVNQQRITHAEKLLSDPDISITQVAIQSGFSSSTSFIRMFKQMKNCTPTEFRKIQETKTFRSGKPIPKSISEENR